MSGASLEREGAVGIITIDNPPVNAMSPGLPGAILERLAEAQADDAVKAVVLRCAGKGGLAGADIRSFGKPWPEGEPTLRDVIPAIERSAKPVIVALSGYGLGGGLELALSCHYRVASRKTEVGQPEVLLGFPPGAGGTQRLPRLAGVETALAMIVDGTHVAATEAAEHGIIDRVVDGDLLEGALAFAKERIAVGPPHALAREQTPKLKDPGIFEATRERLERRGARPAGPDRLPRMRRIGADPPLRRWDPQGARDLRGLHDFARIGGAAPRVLRRAGGAQGAGHRQRHTDSAD